MDVQKVRSRFPALINNQGYSGSQVLGSVPDAITKYMLESNVQMANYALAHKAAHNVENGLAAGAVFAGADSPDDVMFGSSATQLAETLARMIEATVLRQRSGEKVGDGSEPAWNEGDEIVITDADHEANRGAWIRLASRTSLKIVTWPVSKISTDSKNEYSVGLDSKTLSELLNPRTRLVAFTACSNVLGGVVPIKEISTLIRERSKAWIAVDAVAFAPHQPLSPKEWGVDFVLWSWYKVYGPHIGSLYVSPKAKSSLLTKLNHHFLANDPHYTGMYPYQPSSQQYELMSSIPSIMEYFYWLGSTQKEAQPDALDWSSLFKDGHQQELKRVREQVQAASQKMASHEDTLLKELIGFLMSRNDHIKIVGSESHDHHDRVPTVAFVLVGKDGKSLGKSQDFHRELVKSGKVSLSSSTDLDGVVRVSLVHYNTIAEVKAICQAIDDALTRVC